MSEKPIKVAVVISRFNELITDRLLEGALQRIKELKLVADEPYWVPGAFELPLLAQQLAQTKHYDAIICLGAVIRGETDHYNYVCEQASAGCQQVGLQQQLPVIFGVLTTENKEQALARSGGIKGHKGIESVDAAVEMVALLRKVNSAEKNLNHV